MTAAAASDLVNQAAINYVFMDLPANEKVKGAKPTSSTYDAAVLEVLFKRPSGPIMTAIEDFITVRMDSLSFLSQNIEAN